MHRGLQMKVVTCMRKPEEATQSMLPGWTSRPYLGLGAALFLYEISYMMSFTQFSAPQGAASARVVGGSTIAYTCDRVSHVNLLPALI
jgi:hypothetical protein